jgi:hypothetical protein
MDPGATLDDRLRRDRGAQVVNAFQVKAMLGLNLHAGHKTASGPARRSQGQMPCGSKPYQNG